MTEERQKAIWAIYGKKTVEENKLMRLFCMVKPLVTR